MPTVELAKVTKFQKRYNSARDQLMNRTSRNLTLQLLVKDMAEMVTLQRDLISEMQLEAKKQELQSLTYEMTYDCDTCKECHFQSGSHVGHTCSANPQDIVRRLELCLELSAPVDKRLGFTPYRDVYKLSDGEVAELDANIQKAAELCEKLGITETIKS